MTINEEPAEPDAVHVALLAGLLSHVGLRDVGRRDYQGARGARFAIQPGSVLARKQPSWVMVAELMETSRLWGRTAAQIQPSWIEPLAAHLLKYTYEAPHWERKRGSVVATERATLFGLPVVGGPQGRVRRRSTRSCRASSSSAARSSRATGTHATSSSPRTLACWRSSRSSSTAPGAATSSPATRRSSRSTTRASRDDVVSAAHFDRWWKAARRSDPALLTFPRDLLVDADDAADLLDPRARPDSWRQGDLELALSYRFEPGTDDDGVTVHVPLHALSAAARRRLRLARAGPAPRSSSSR